MNYIILGHMKLYIGNENTLRVPPLYSYSLFSDVDLENVNVAFAVIVLLLGFVSLVYTVTSMVFGAIVLKVS